MKMHTPTRHGNWRVIDGHLVDEDAQAVPADAIADAEEPKPSADAGTTGESSPQQPPKSRRSFP